MARKSALIKVAGSIQDLRIKSDYGGDRHAKRLGIKNWRFFKLLYLVGNVGNESVITCVGRKYRSYCYWLCFLLLALDLEVVLCFVFVPELPLGGVFESGLRFAAGFEVVSFSPVVSGVDSTTSAGG